jgi:hypothetical protein
MKATRSLIEYGLRAASLLALAIPFVRQVHAQKASLCTSGMSANWVLTCAFAMGRLAWTQDMTTLISVGSQGNQSNDESELWANRIISADGQYLTLLNYASNLVPGDTNHLPDVFVHDRLTGETAQVSVSWR